MDLDVEKVVDREPVDPCLQAAAKSDLGETRDDSFFEHEGCVQLYRVLGIFRSNNRRYRTERLAIEDLHVWRHVIENRRRHDRAVGLTAGHELGALRDSVVDH